MAARRAAQDVCTHLGGNGCCWVLFRRPEHLIDRVVYTVVCGAMCGKCCADVMQA